VEIVVAQIQILYFYNSASPQIFGQSLVNVLAVSGTLTSALMYVQVKLQATKMVTLGAAILGGGFLRSLHGVVICVTSYHQTRIGGGPARKQNEVISNRLWLRKGERRIQLNDADEDTVSRVISMKKKKQQHTSRQVTIIKSI
jgi:hypothetical protein